MSFMQAWEAGGQAGQQAKKDKALRQFMVPAMQGQQDAFTSLIQSGATGEAMQAQQYAATQAKSQQEAQAASYKQLGGLAAGVVKASQAGDPAQLQGTYAALVQRARALDPNADLPDAFDPNDLPDIYKLVAMGGGDTEAEQFTLAPGSARYDASGRQVAAQPFAPANAQLANVPTGDGGTQQMVWDPRTRQFAQPSYGGEPQGMSGGGAQAMESAYRGAQLDPVNDFQQFGQTPGVQVSSLHRTPQHNAKVGGTARSFHVSGEAGDFVVSPEQKAAFIANARAKGYQAIDEGDHVHVEPPGRGMTRSQFGQGQRLGYTPPKAKAQTSYSPLSSDEVAQLGLPSGTVAQRNMATGQARILYRPPASAGNGAGKALSQGTIKELTKDASKFQNLGELIQGFKPDFAGNGVGGSVENLAGRLGGSMLGIASKGQAEWWQQYDRYKNEVRNELFGASLTEGEQRAFEAADITPNMSPAVVEKNLAMQAKVIRDGLQRKAKTWTAQGYNPEAIEQASGIKLGDSAPKRRASDSSMKPQAAAQASPRQRQIKRTGTANGRKVVEYTDGTIDYAD